MTHYNDFFKDFMSRYNYPEIAVETFSRVLKRLDDEKDFGDKIDELVTAYMNPENEELGPFLDKVTELSKEYNENEYTMHFIFLLLCTPILKENYEKAGIPEYLYWDTMDDLRCKLKECIDCEEVAGTFVAGWFNGFFKLERFAYGRFQYEISDCRTEKDYVLSCGKVVKDGDTYIGFHIPSSGIPLTDDVRLDSYKKAYQAYKHLFPDGIVIFGCGSWLLYPPHYDFLPENSNILKFMSDFEIVKYKSKDEFSDGWRVFAKDSDLPIDQLPRNTSLRRAFADWLQAGNKTGDGFGLIAFDGEKILR
ncbi:MAG: DUF5596 domain-containing protein [Clostridia bacterium]|nr:DUF5596 domain-containing protein [Clostridia bacterium]